MSVQKKGEIYYAVVMYRDAANEKKYKWVPSGTSLREAQKLERKLRNELDKGEITFSKKTLVLDFLEEWMKVVIRPKKRPSTIANYEAQIKNLNRGLGHFTVQKLTAKEIENHYNEERNRGLSETSIEYQHAVLKQALDVGISWRMITKNPAKEILDPPKRGKPKNAVYTPEQVQLLLDVAEDTDMYIPVLLGFLCGLRRGEICGLRRNLVSLPKKAAYIKYSLDRMPKEAAIKLYESEKIAWYGSESKNRTSVLALGPVKTDDSEGYIPLPDLVVHELGIDWLASLINMEKFGSSYQDNDFVWAWEDGRPHDPDYLYHAFKKLIKKCNELIEQDEDLSPAEKKAMTLPIIRPHDMRHTHATILLRRKVDIKIVSKKIRHKRASFTQDYYQHVQDDMQTETAAAMDELFTKK